MKVWFELWKKSKKYGKFDSFIEIEKWLISNYKNGSVIFQRHYEYKDTYNIVVDSVKSDYFVIEIKKLSYVELKKGKLSRETEGSAGWDVFSTEHVVIPAGRSRVVKCGIVTEMSKDRCCLLLDKSGLSAESRITRRAGFIDSDYPDEWGVVMVNESVLDFEIKVGDKIAQAHFMQVLPEDEFITGPDNPDGFVVKKVAREGGFGSTGK